MTEKEVEKKGLTPEDLKRTHTHFRAGEVYSDLYSQAAYLGGALDSAQSDMVEILTDLFQYLGYGAVNVGIESIKDYTNTFFVRDFDTEEDPSVLQDSLLEYKEGIYFRCELAKAMLKLYLKSDKVRELKGKLDLTQKNILL